MGIFDIFKTKNKESISTISQKQKSLYEMISEALVDGELPKDFSLPTEAENGIAWMDGAADGVCIYHMASMGIGKEEENIMAEALKVVSEGDYQEADRLFARLGENVRAISAIDEFQTYIAEHINELNIENIYNYAIHAVIETCDTETVKYGLVMLGLFKTENIKEIIRTIGLSDEFSIFAIINMLKWEDGNNEVFQLAKKIHGWGRIHAVERIEPTTDEIKKWMLLEGVHNNVMTAYSALECWRKSDAYNTLMAGPTKDEYIGIRDIINGLLDEGPAAGISQIEGSDDILIRFLNVVKEFADSIDDYEVVRSIKIHYEDEENKNAEIESLCEELLISDRCKALAAEAVTKGWHIDLAREVGVNYKDDVFAVMEADLEHKNHLCLYLMDDPEYMNKVLELFRRRLVLSELKGNPGTTIGFGMRSWKQRAVQHVLQELRRYPLEGLDFVEAALQSESIRTRNMALGTIKSWIKKEGKPLSEFLPDFQVLLSNLREIEPDKMVKESMSELISGKVDFR